MGLGYSFRDGDWPRLRQIIQKLSSLNFGPDATPTLAGLTLTGLTATLLIQTDSDKALASVADLTAWILQSTANQVVVTDNGDGTVTLSLPQDIDTAADVQFGSANITNTAIVGRLLAGGVTE